ncbi:uncharacterized protein LOC100208814 [Hydra vulgaris]|uniref:uncharacterized protein LOC100208814 n=1 Tax=Hydra vulgaris TaxID=6087 RepID=UPI0032EA87E3
MLLGIDNYNSFVEVLTKIGRNDLVIYFFEISNSPNKDSNISFKKDLLRMSAELKKFYLNYYGKIGELQPLLKASANVDLIQKFIDLCIVDAVNAQIDAYFSVEQKEFLEKQIRYTPIPYSDIFVKEKPVILISGIAGIGKTWLLQRMLLIGQMI